MKMDVNHIDVMNDNYFKIFIKSKEARGLFSSFLSAITNLPKEIFLNAEIQGGDLTKSYLEEKQKTSDVVIKIDDNRRIIVEMNKSYYDGLFEKNTQYAYNLSNYTTKIGNKREYPKIILINIDNFNTYHTKKAVLHFVTKEIELGYIENNLYNSYHLIVENAIKSEYNEEEEVKKFALLLTQKNLNEMIENYKGDEEYMAGIVKIEDMLKYDVDKYGLVYEKEDTRALEDEYIKRIAREEERKSAAIELHKNGVSDEVIIKSLHLTEEELKEIFEENKI